MKNLVCYLILACTSSTVFAQEFFVNIGETKSVQTSEQTYNWSVEFFKHLNENWGASVSWPNEGHYSENNLHHRDGHSAQLWLKKDLNKNIRVMAGFGPYVYYDTTGTQEDQNYKDEHGLGAQYSLAGVLSATNPWLFKVQYNFIDTFGSSFDTSSLTFGIGYNFGSISSKDYHKSQDYPDYDFEITIFGGVRILNSFESEKNATFEIEYRKNISDYIGWTLPVEFTVSAIEEGEDDLIDRAGVATKLWFTTKSFNGLKFGVGAGPYFFKDSKNPDSHVGAITTFSTSYDISENSLIRISCDRTLTKDRDTDRILAGIGYKFN